MQKLIKSVFFLCLTALLIIQTASALELTGRVVSVADGDTVTVLLGDNRQAKIRLAQIDAPESRQDFGNASKKALSDMIFNKVVRVEYDGSDRYGRVIGTIFLGKKDINLELVNQGMAWVYRQYAKDQRYYDAEQVARNKKVGIWSQTNPTPIPPWEWRKGSRSAANNQRQATPVQQQQRQARAPVTNMAATSEGIRGNRNSKIYHYPRGCPSYDKISPRNIVNFDSAADAESAGYRVARNCK